jgi:hypothetical protein
MRDSHTERRLPDAPRSDCLMHKVPPAEGHNDDSAVSNSYRLCGLVGSLSKDNTILSSLYPQTVHVNVLVSDKFHTTAASAPALIG